MFLDFSERNVGDIVYKVIESNESWRIFNPQISTGVKRTF